VFREAADCDALLNSKVLRFKALVSLELSFLDKQGYRVVSKPDSVDGAEILGLPGPDDPQSRVIAEVFLGATTVLRPSQPAIIEQLKREWQTYNSTF